MAGYGDAAAHGGHQAVGDPQANAEAARRYVARRRENSANIRTQNEAIITRIRDNPTVRDIEMGDALNAAVNQLTDPRVSSAALRLATAPIEANVLQEIAFRNAASAVVIVLSQIRNVTRWPAALAAPRFAEEKKTFEAIVDKAIKEDEEGEVSSDTLKSAYDLRRSTSSATRWSSRLRLKRIRHSSPI